MSSESILKQFDQLKFWSRGDERAPHKPLLVLYALGRWSRGDRSEIPFSEVNEPLTALLKERQAAISTPNPNLEGALACQIGL